MRRYPFIVTALALIPACFSPAQVDPIAETDGSETTATTSSATGDTKPGPGSSGSSSGDGTTLPTGVDTSGTDTGDTTDTETSEESGTGGLVCDGPLVACGTGACEIDRMVDPLHCGECGHDCLGGECGAGECQPVSLLVQGGLRDIAADDDYVYFASDSTVERATQETSPTVSVLSDIGVKAGGGKREIELSADGVVMSGGPIGGGYVRLVPYDGGPAQDLHFDAPGSGGVPKLRATSSRAFWVTRTPSSPFEYGVLGSTIDGASQATYITGLGEDINALAVNNLYVFFVDREATTIVRALVGGAGAQTTVASDLGTCWGMVASEDRLFFSCDDLKDTTSLWAADLDGGNPTVLLTNDSPDFALGRALVFSEGRLFWWDLEDGLNHLRQVEEDGSGARTIYTTPSPIANDRLALSSEAFFFAEDATVRMLAR